MGRCVDCAHFKLCRSHYFDYICHNIETPSYFKHTVEAVCSNFSDPLKVLRTDNSDFNQGGH